MSMISASPRDTMAPAFRASARTTDDALAFTLDVNGAVSAISRDLAEFLSIKVGDTLVHLALQANSAVPDRQDRIVELADRFRINRRVKIWPRYQDDLITGYAARVVLSTMSDALRQHLRDVQDLTASEIEILQLVFRRLNLEQVAEMRGIKLSTVRTHVSRIISKLNCRSLVEAVSTTLELSHALDHQLPPADNRPGSDENRVRFLSLPTAGEQVEYRRYGPTSGRPIIVLHSLEYGYLPPAPMAALASHQHLNLIFPIRPGFGGTTRAESTQHAAKLLADFIRAMDLSDVTIIGLSTAAPLALHLSDANPRIKRTVLVNYGLNVADKLKGIQPNWIRGMLRMALNSPSSFAFGRRTLTTIIRSFGGLRFYRRLYANQTSDQDYLEHNAALFETMSNYLVRANSQSIRHDLVSAFLANRDLETSVNDGRDILVVNSSDQHGVSAAEARADAKRLDVRFEEAPYPGRNWMFQEPGFFFDLVLDQ